MLGSIIKTYLAKPRQPGLDVSPKQESLRTDIGLKCEFGPGTKADRNRWGVGTGKTARGGGSEFGRNQCLRDFGGTTCDRMQAVIAHGALLQSYLAIDETLLDPFGCYLKAPRGKKGKSQWASKVSRNERCQRSIPHCWNCRWVRRVIGWHDGSYGRDNRNRHLPRGGQRSANAWRLRLARPHQPLDRAPANLWQSPWREKGRRVTQVRLAAGHRNPGNDRKRRQLVRDTYPNRKGFVHEIPGFQLCTCPAGDAGARAID